ncbi:phosphotransferase enzyme family domain-containing protein [Penicillium angulare]|uniref:phosphotransferase enzyme family domain-containing protein n=1 Tax=Penicillium angulare TaxID=116970 RepID=UPI0025422F2E|nr:phosphotransferase enzyme family domain-containing protein [Penicillium angulare]KAJ5287500.1 phosphotransferase enzyme family domain-containing protein [Penicillium angulare]
MEKAIESRVRPSARWTSFEGWNYNGMKERLETALANLNKEALLSHAETIKGQKLSMSENFSATSRQGNTGLVSRW